MYRPTGSPRTKKSSDLKSWSGEANVESKDPMTLSKGDVVLDVIPTPVEETELHVNAEDKSTYVNAAFESDAADPEDLHPHLPSYAGDHPQHPYINHHHKPSSSSHEDKSSIASRIFDWFSSIKDKASSWMKIHRLFINSVILLSLFLLFNVYLGFAIHLTWSTTTSWCEGVKLLVIVTCVSYFVAFYSLVLKRFVLRPLARRILPVAKLYNKVCHYRYTNKIVWSLVWTAVLVFLVLDTENDRFRLVSAAGLLVLLFLGFIFSAHPRRIVWRHVLWGVLLQFVFALVILRWSVGKELFECLGDKVKTFLEFTDSGSSFVFGYLVSGQIVGTVLQVPVFAFKVLSVVIFFSFFISILYYYGIMQILVIQVGWLLQHTVGTTACESMNAAGNIFLGMTEAPLMIRPYLPIMTKSELHAVLTGGFATIAGSVMAAYITFGVSASHLLSASVMSAPAALAFSKLVYPETEESKTHAQDITVEKPKETNALEAATNGASVAIALVANIAANLVAFIAFIAFLDAIVKWLGTLVEWDFLSFEWLLSKIFIPLSALMGVEVKDHEKVANLVGLKTVVNEFVAYQKLGEFKKENALSPRSEAIATFALCGFSNISSIGIQIGALGAMAPERKSDLSSLAVRAMIAGSAACFMTACIAGALLTNEDLQSRVF